MLINLRGVVSNPWFVFATGALGSLCTILVKGGVDWWTSNAKNRQDSVGHFFQQVELLAPSYYLMINHASLLSWRLDSYLQFKREKMALLDSDQFAYKLLAQSVETTAAEALFEAGKLYRVITDRFFIDGGDYVVPDRWANEALNGLHDKMMALLTFDSNVLLKHIDSKTERQEFLTKLNSPESEPEFADLRKQYTLYKDWVGKHDKEVRLLAETARAYSDLFRQEVKLLYEAVWSGETNDPLQAEEVIGSGEGLSTGTRELIKGAAREKDLFEGRLATAQSAGAASTAADAFLSVGWSYYEARHFDLALGEFNKAVELCPSSAAAHNNLGNAYTNKGDFERAGQAYSRAASIDQKNPVYKHNQGKMESRRKNAEHLGDAVNLFREAIALGNAMDSPDDAQQALRLNDLAATLSGLERWDEAVAAYGEAIFLQPFEPVLYGNLANTYASKYLSSSDAKALDAALGEYTMAARLSTGRQAAEYQREVAITYQRAERWKESEGAFELAVNGFEADGDKAETYYQLGQMFGQQKDWHRAADAYAQALALDGNRSSLYASTLIDAIQESGSKFPIDITDKAIQACKTAIGDNPADLDHRDRLSHIYFVLGDKSRFLEERDKIVRLAMPRSGPGGDVTVKQMAGYYNQLGLAYRRMNIQEMALDYYGRAIEMDADPEFQRNLGLYLQALGRYDEARRALEPASKRRDGDVDLMLSLAEVTFYGSEHDLEEAIRLCKAALVKQPSKPAAHFFLGQLLIRRGDYAEATAEYRKALDLRTSGADEVAIYLKNGTNAYDTVIQAGSDNVETQYGRALMYYWRKDYTEASKGYDKAQEMAGDHRLNSISILNAMAQLCYQQGAYQCAKTKWKQARDIGGQLSADEKKMLPNAPLGRIDLEQITNNLGTAYDALGEEDNALECYQTAASNSPKTYVAHFNLGRGLYQQKRFDLALSQFQETLRLGAAADDYYRTVYSIGNCYYRLGYTDISVEKWDEVLASDVYSGHALYNLGVWLWLQDRKPEAGKRWEATLKASPTLLDAEFNLGVLDLTLGDTAAAIAHWQNIADKPGFETLNQTIKDVQDGGKPPMQIRDIREV